jgi:hypothetical protein
MHRIMKGVDDVLELSLTEKCLAKFGSRKVPGVDEEKNLLDDAGMLFRKVNVANLGFLNDGISTCVTHGLDYGEYLRQNSRHSRH